ncbi:MULTISPECIES: hypothetical protein [unclassified Myroides]|uniref:hypothetical protein n=1 Tax=unclassified Myroides TaxID=2642485 RepID=UPI003D2F8F3D
MSRSKGKTASWLPFIFILVFMSYGSSQLLSLATIPLEMASALVMGEPYTGKLEQVRDEYEAVYTGIIYDKEDGTQGFIPAERLSDLTVDYFGATEQVVLLDEMGGTFWLTYEDLGIAYAILLVAFFALRLVLSLVLIFWSVLSGKKVMQQGKIGIKLLLKPLRLLLFGCVLIIFYQNRIFAYEEEIDFFSLFLGIYALYFSIVVLLRVRSAKQYWTVHSTNETSNHPLVPPTATVADATSVFTTPTTKHENDLIQREKRTFKHQTSRYN